MWQGTRIEIIVIYRLNTRFNCFSLLYSGAEDMHAYLWDRYYGVCLAKYQHGDVVNSVAFNSRDSEMLVTTSDDYTIKVSSISRLQEDFYEIAHLYAGLAIDRKVQSIKRYRNQACH